MAARFNMDRSLLLTLLMHADESLAEGTLRINSQRELVTRLEATGRDASRARILLAESEHLQLVRTFNRSRLVAELLISADANDAQCRGRASVPKQIKRRET